MAIQNTHFGAKNIAEMLSFARSVYFIGIGGINMSSLALITALRGYRVAGSDRTPSAITKKLSDSGILVNYSHDAKNIADFDAVVYTVAISPDNDEYVKAQEMGIPIKGIGLKTAQRIIVDLKDKIATTGMETVSGSISTLSPAHSEIHDEAVAALTMLGFAQSPSQKVVAAILKEEPNLSVEKVIKLALKRL